MATLAPAAPRRLERAALLLRPLFEGVVALSLTALLVIWIVDLALSRIGPQGLTINLLLFAEPFGGMGTLEALGFALRRSGVLLLVALGGATLVGIAMGTLYSFSRSPLLRGAAWTLGIIGSALPSFFWAMLLLLGLVALYRETGLRPFPTYGYGIDEHLVLPAIALGARPAAYLFRTTATAFEEVRHGDYVRVARAKGLLGRLIVRRHVLPNAAPAILGGFGIAARSGLSSLLIIEYVFGWHGAGYGFIHAVAFRDITFATLIAVSFALVFTLVGIVVAITARMFDPRIERR